MRNLIRKKIKEQLVKEKIIKEVTPNEIPMPVLFDIAGEIKKRIPEVQDENINTYVGVLSGLRVNLQLWKAPVDELYQHMEEQQRSFSDINLENIKNKIEEKGDLDPVITLDGKFIDGGHRLLAYKQLGIGTIPAVDFKELLEAEKEEFES